MKRKYIKSSAIKTVGYDSKNEILEIEFHNDGAVWQYLQFSDQMFEDFMNASSKGNFFVTQIKGNFPEKRVK